MMNVGNNVI